MKTKELLDLGRFSVEVELANHEDVVRTRNGELDPAKVRRTTILGVVDSGAARLVLPPAVVKQLGFPAKKDKVRVKYADGRKGLRTEVEEVHLYLLGRDGVFKAIVEPSRETALIGAIVLEDLDFLMDCTRGRLVPREPKHVLSEIE